MSLSMFSGVFLGGYSLADDIDSGKKIIYIFNDDAYVFICNSERVRAGLCVLVRQCIRASLYSYEAVGKGSFIDFRHCCSSLCACPFVF